jgi:hypothetical protein
MSRSGYLAAIADPIAGNADGRRHLTLLLPPRRPYGIEPPRPADATAAGPLPAGEAAQPDAPHAPDPAPERTAPAAVAAQPSLDTEAPSARPPAPASDANGPGHALAVRSWPADPHTRHAEPDVPVGAPRDAARSPAVGWQAPRPDHMTVPGSPRPRSAAAHPAEASAALVPPTRAVADDDRTRPREHEAARRAAREPARVHIGTIDLTVVPPPQPGVPATPAPPRAARTAPADAPLSRGPGPWFGLGQR